MNKNGVPYQVYLPPTLRDKAKRKARDNGVALSHFVRMAVEQFVERPIEKSMAQLRRHYNRRK